MQILKNTATTLDFLIEQSKVNIDFVLLALLMLLIIHTVNAMLGYRLTRLGIMPRCIFGMPGIVLSSLIHYDFNHLFYNSIPLFFLLNFVLILTPSMSHFYCVTVGIVLLSGSAIWLFGRRAIHIGASSLVMGYFAYCLAYAYYQVSLMTILLAIVLLYYLSGLFLNLLPGGKDISWEGHVFGFLAGLMTVYLCG